MTAADDLLATLRARRSVRRFGPDPVPRETLERLLEAASWAPSAGGRQDWEFTAIASEALKLSMAAAVTRRWAELLEGCSSQAVRETLGPYTGNFDWFARAPVVIAVWARRPETFLTRLLEGEAAGVAGSRTSAAMAAQNLMLAASALGLGSCCLTGPLAAADSLRDLLEVDRRHELVCLLAVGFPAEAPSPAPRRPVSRIARFL